MSYSSTHIAWQLYLSMKQTVIIQCWYLCPHCLYLHMLCPDIENFSLIDRAYLQNYHIPFLGDISYPLIISSLFLWEVGCEHSIAVDWIIGLVQNSENWYLKNVRGYIDWNTVNITTMVSILVWLEIHIIMIVPHFYFFFNSQLYEQKSRIYSSFLLKILEAYLLITIFVFCCYI